MLKQKFLVHFGSNFIARILGMFAGIIVARIAGPEVVGTIAYGTSYVMLWSFISGVFGSGHIKLISEGQDIGKCISVFTRLYFGSVIVYFFVVIGFFLFQKYILNVNFGSTTQQAVIVILLSSTILEKFYQYSNATFTATMEQAKANLPIFVKSVIWQIGRIIVVFFGLKAIGLVTWNLVITVLLLPLVFNLIKKSPRTGWDHNLFKRHISYAMPILLIVIINSIIQYSDKLLLAHYTNTTELGYYSAANSIGGMIMLASMTVGNIFFPLFSSLLAKNDWAAVKQKIMQFQEFLSIFVFPLVCLIVIISVPLITTVLGSRYEPSIKPFMIISFATYITLVGMPYGNTITGAGRFYLNVWINGIKLIVFILSITFFVSPQFLGLGATGLSLNLLVINLFTNLLFLYFSKRLSKLSFFSFRNTFRHVIIFSVSFILYIYQDTFNEWFSFWWIVIIPVYIVFIYGIMFLLGLINMEHFKKFADLINVQKIITYVNNELGDKK